MPLVPLRIFRLRAPSSAYAIQLLISGGVTSMFFFLTLDFQLVHHYGPLRSGLAFLPASVGVVAAAGAVVPLVGRVGVRPLVTAGAALITVALILFGRLNGSSNYTARVLVPMLLLAAGVGASFVPLTVAASIGVPEQDAGLAAGLLTTSMQLGSAVGLALLAAIAARATEASIGYDHGFRLGAGLAGVATMVAVLALPARVGIARSG